MRPLLLLLMLCTVQAAWAQPSTPSLAHLEMRSSTVCEMCKKTIEENLIYEKGVKKVQVDLERSVVLVSYSPKKNSEEGLRQALRDLGYWADGVAGAPEAFAKLPACCQKEGCGKATLPSR
jgi:periplasmic mercuric ion binding protein